MADTDFETPIMPTGSGVADLEIAREQDALAAGLADADAGDIAPLPSGDAALESEAHPS